MNTIHRETALSVGVLAARRRCSSLVLSIPAVVFQDDKAREILVDLNYRLENEFRTWSVRRLPAGRVLEESCLKLPEESYVFTIYDPDSLLMLAEEIFSDAVRRLPRADCQLSIWFAGSTVGSEGQPAPAVH